MKMNEDKKKENMNQKKDRNKLEDIVKDEIKEMERDMGSNKMEVKKELPTASNMMKKLSSWEPRRIVRVKNVKILN